MIRHMSCSSSSMQLVWHLEGQSPCNKPTLVSLQGLQNRLKTKAVTAVVFTDSRKSRQKMVKKRHTFVKIAKITAKSPQFI